ncbi:PepSY domain-containing protein [Epidermidibacterium keratini]|uniref:PepSY domain-containing protein n=1 Tax=Epidermidibacterium keratini TaxID=1891644 RepID=A0A7L4YLH6_9ACTN|nr:PepSY domain-containing protein [Epidermidibacterium keratini]QHB99901.1 PepSY domain-containing protein [Epidermidibacterium keratini]
MSELQEEPVLSGHHRTRADRGSSDWWRDDLRPLVARIHFYAGMFIAPFIAVAAFTGLLYALTPQIEQLVYRDILTVQPAGQALPLAEQVTAAIDEVPDGAVAAVRPAAEPDAVTRVVFNSPSAPDDRQLTAFVNPYSGEITDVLPTYGEWLPLRTWFDDLHRHLLLGEPGRVYSELAASWLWVLGLSGLALWTVRRVRRRQVRQLVIPQRGARGRGRLMGRHGALGVWLLLGMLFLSATGLTWSQFAGANVASVRAQLDWTAPPVAGQSASLVSAADVPEAVELVAASAADAGLSRGIEIVPSSEATGWRVSETKRSWPVEQDSISVDPVSGDVLNRVDFADWPFAAKLANLGIDLHMGILFGVANQIALALLAIGIITMVVLGYRMWWKRRPTSGAAYARPLGGAKSPSAPAIFAVALVGIAVGIFMPVLGASLLIFLAVDTVLHTLRARRTSASLPS